MRIPFYWVDAFSHTLFSGNPAAVCLLEDWPEDATLQAIATENKLAETAFVVCRPEAVLLRWFTPKTEVALCGHATLATAHVLFSYRAWPSDMIRFLTRQSGELAVTRREQLLEMNFPSRAFCKIQPPAGLAEALNITPLDVYDSEEDLLVLAENEKIVRELSPDFQKLEGIACRGVIVTAAGDATDFVSRFFAPRIGIDEDPVTGSAHCVLIPFWAKRLGKTELLARQVSKRGGTLFCRHQGSRVHIAGHAVLYLEGELVL